MYQTAQADGDLEFRLLNGEKREVEAGANMNLLIMVSNHSNTDKEFTIRPNNQTENWKLIAGSSSVKIEKMSTITKIVGIRIPGNCQSGDYSIELDAFENSGQQAFGKINIPVHVKPRYEIQLEKLQNPAYLFAGDTLNASFLVQNLSNLDIPVTIDAVVGQESKVSHRDLPKDSSLLANIPIIISKDINNYTQQTVILSVSVADKPETEKTISYTYDVFPSERVKFDIYNRYPLKVSGVAISSNSRGPTEYSTMYDISGTGYINEAKKQRLDLHLRGPNRSGNPLFGLNDEYFLIYHSRKTELVLGDNNYSMSDLTESSRNGRGVRFEYATDKLSVGTFYNSPRYYPTIKQIYALGSTYRFNDKNSLSVGYLTKIDTLSNHIQLMTVYGANAPFSWMNMDYELALGQEMQRQSKAYRGSIYLRRSFFSTHFSYMYADPDFPGYVSNTVKLFTGMAVNFSKLSFYLNYDINDSRMELDTLYSNAPFSKNLSLTAGFRINSYNTVSLGIYSISLKDKAPTPLFDYSKYNGRLALQNNIGPVDTNLQGEFGKIENFLGIQAGDLTNFYNGALSVNYHLNKSLSILGSVSYQGGQQYQITGYDRFYYGASAVSDLNGKFSLSFHYNSNYELKDYSRDRSLLALQMHCKLNPKHDISLTTNYNLIKNTLNQKEFSIQLRYAYSIGIPVSRKKDIGILTGRILDHGVGNVGGIRLNLNGLVTITDKDGNFRFPMAKVGTYILKMDESSFGLNAIPEEQGPYRVVIEPGKVTQFELAMTRSARIEGRVVVQEDERSKEKGYFPTKEEINKLIIEASRGSEVFRILSDRNGTFRFEDLRPGSWHIKVYPNGIPYGYQLLTAEFNLSLASGKEEKLDVVLKKKSRQIKIQSKL